jgi:hypothetical protein
VLTSLPIFILSFFDVPKGVLEKIDYFRSSFFDSMTAQKKYRLTKLILCANQKTKGVQEYKI